MGGAQPAAISVPLTLKTQVAEWIRAAIFRGSLKPGEGLREIALAKQYGVAQSTVREALIELEHRGLVHRETNRRTAVTELTATELRERLELRLMLETMAGQRAALSWQPDDTARLRGVLVDLQKAVVANDYYLSAQLDHAFHRSIWEASQNATLVRTLEQVVVPLFAFISMKRSSGQENLVDVFQSHEPIVESLESGNGERIAQAMAAHLRGSYDALMDG